VRWSRFICCEFHFGGVEGESGAIGERRVRVKSMDGRSEV
jgi:hypothetical protein